MIRNLLTLSHALLVLLIGSTLIAVGIFVAPISVQAQQPASDCEFGDFEARLPGIEGDICAFADSDTPITSFVGVIARIIIGLIVMTGLIMVVIGGYVYMTAGGSGERVNLAKTIISSAIVGIILALTSYLILNTINPGILNSEPSLGITSNSTSDSGSAAKLAGLCSEVQNTCKSDPGAQSCLAASSRC